MDGEDNSGECPHCNDEIGHILLEGGEYIYQPCGCPAVEVEADD